MVSIYLQEKIVPKGSSDHSLKIKVYVSLFSIIFEKPFFVDVDCSISQCSVTSLEKGVPK